MAYTADSLPFVGRLPACVTGRGGKGEWISARYNSYGMANGLGCGEAVAKMMLGVKVSR
jgi:glycine/D-amino acid oxidase-like deaminating enzyme